MRFTKSSLLSLVLVLMFAFLLSACTPAKPTSTVDPDNSTTDDDDTAVIDDTDEDDTFGDEEDDITDDIDEDEVMPDDDVDDEDTTEDDDPSTTETKGSIAGKYCYPTSPIPTSLRAYVKNAKTGYYWYVTSKGKSTWEITELEPATYNVYLAGADGSGLEEGRYLNADNSWKTITLKAGDKVTAIEPCDFDF
jgi:hypothetical protein